MDAAGGGVGGVVTPPGFDEHVVDDDFLAGTARRLTHALMLDERWLLDVAQSLVPGDPDYGALAAAVARHRHDVMGTLVYDGPHERAAALLHSLARVPALESGNELFAAQVAYAYLHASGLPVKVGSHEVIALVTDVTERRCGVRQAAEALKTWG